MFNFLKSDPIKKLDKEYGVLLEQAMQAQRRGDIEGYAKLTEQAEAVKAKLDEAKG
ncbi:DUF6435 family protein [Marinomonas colpomeniae]|uniref:Lacal_2735 family protein n=1 Tax=Marinomonas colpomeniae TaxID=2774408 RepID=A0ABR8P2I7_9GAMM|nr:DUF6435 family protein [Marinomonas colpomeniae]MBD5772490.1 Lacal_2735 family protein [Marinomonas colpomeniae]